MRVDKKTTWSLRVLICFFFIFSTALGYSADNDNSKSRNDKQKIVPKTYKIKTEQLPEIKSGPKLKLKPNPF